MSAPRIGFVGMGEAVFHIAKGLRDDGLSGIQAYDKMWNVAPQSELVGRRAQEAGVALAPSLQALVEGVDIVICAVSASLAVSLARECLPWLRPDQIYADFNSAGPQTKIIDLGGRRVVPGRSEPSKSSSRLVPANSLMIASSRKWLADIFLPSSGVADAIR